MFDFQEELKKFSPSTDADLAAFELSGEEAADMQALLRLVMQDFPRATSSQFDQLGLEMEDIR